LNNTRTSFYPSLLSNLPFFRLFLRLFVFPHSSARPGYFSHAAPPLRIISLFVPDFPSLKWDFPAPKVFSHPSPLVCLLGLDVQVCPALSALIYNAIRVHWRFTPSRRHRLLAFPQTRFFREPYLQFLSPSSSCQLQICSPIPGLRVRVLLALFLFSKNPAPGKPCVGLFFFSPYSSGLVYFVPAPISAIRRQRSLLWIQKRDLFSSLSSHSLSSHVGQLFLALSCSFPRFFFNSQAPDRPPHFSLTLPPLPAAVSLTSESLYFPPVFFLSIHRSPVQLRPPFFSWSLLVFGLSLSSLFFFSTFPPPILASRALGESPFSNALWKKIVRVSFFFRVPTTLFSLCLTFPPRAG